MFLPFFVLSLMYLFDLVNYDVMSLEIPVFVVAGEFMAGPDRVWFKICEDDILNEMVMLGLLASLCLTALSRERDEDEMTGLVRMQSFVWSFWVTAAILAFGILFIYRVSFLSFAFAAIFLIFLIYIFKFNLSMKKIRRECK